MSVILQIKPGNTENQTYTNGYGIPFTQLLNQEIEDPGQLYNLIYAQKGDYIYYESHYLNKVYFVKEGFIKIGYFDSNGNEIVKEILQRGEIFGQFTLDNKNLNGEFAKAHKADASVCAFNIESFQTLLNNNNKLAVAYGKQVGNKLRKVENRLLNVLNSNVKTRLLHFITELIYSNPNCIQANSFRMNNFLTHDDIARLIGSSRQTVTMSIKELEIKKYLKISRRQIQIDNIKAIEKAASK